MNALISFCFFLSPVLCQIEYYEGSYNKIRKQKILPITYRLKIVYPDNMTNTNITSIKAIFSYIDPPVSSIPDEPFQISGIFVKPAQIFFLFFTREPFVQIQKNSVTYQENLGKYIQKYSNLSQEQQTQYHSKFKEMIRNQTTPKNYITYIYKRVCNDTCYLFGSQSNQASRLIYTSTRTYDHIKLDQDWRLFVSLFGLVTTFKAFVWLIIPKTQPSFVCSAAIQYLCMSEFATSLLFFGTRHYFDTLNTTVFTVILVFSLFITFYYGSNMSERSAAIEIQLNRMSWIYYLSNFRYFYFFNVFSFFHDFPMYSLFLMFSFLIPQIVFSAVYNKKKTIGLIFIFSLVFAQLCSVYLIIDYHPNKDFYFKEYSGPKMVKYPAIWVSIQLFIIVLQKLFGGAFFIPKKSRLPRFSYTAEKPPHDSECAICLGIIGDDEDFYSTPCHHYFHQECLSRWMEENAICPICRTPLPPIEDTPD